MAHVKTANFVMVFYIVAINIYYYLFQIRICQKVDGIYLLHGTTSPISRCVSDTFPQGPWCHGAVSIYSYALCYKLQAHYTIHLYRRRLIEHYFRQAL